MSTNIPIIDFEQVTVSPKAVAHELLQACADWGMLLRPTKRSHHVPCADRSALGFFYVKNHPIPQEAVDGIFDLVSLPSSPYLRLANLVQEKQFFAQPLSTKLQAPYIPAKNAGFKPASSNG